MPSSSRSDGAPPPGDHGVLSVVGTPIGNLGDLSPRARDTLAAADLVVAEDTRRTRALLSHLGIRVRLVSLPAEAERERAGSVIALVREGRHVALVTDAGMPGVSDPGALVVAGCVDAGLEVRVVPGPSAAVAALVVSGLPADRVAFEGFLPRKGSARGARLAALAAEPRTAVIFESPRRVVATLRDLLAAGGDRRAVVARELTKVHEEILRGSLAELAAGLEGRELKGEVVIVVEGGTMRAEPSLDDAVAEAGTLVAGGMRRRAAATEAGRRHGVPANQVYEGLLSQGRDDTP